VSVSSSLDADIRKILKRWTKMGAYVYMRPISSTYIDASKPHRIYWRVQVELRAVPPSRWNGEGFNLDDVIRELDAEVPRNRKAYDDAHIGWLAPAKLEKAEDERYKKAEEEHYKKKAEKKRPKKRPTNVVDINSKRKKKRVAK
jgi:hypothetical protein